MRPLPRSVQHSLMRYTVSPLLGRLLLPRIIRRLFEPAPVPERFDRLFPKEMMLRPSQLRAAAADTALMIPAATELQARYRELKLPIVIVTGADDKIADVGRQSRHLHAEIPQSPSGEFMRFERLLRSGAS